MTATPSDIGLDACFPARSEGLGAALSALERFCAARNLGSDLVSRARIIVEELFTNTIKYGYRGECDLPVRLAFSTDPALTIVFEDDAEAFDPTRWEPPHRHPTPEDGPEGKAGIPMVIGLAASVVYVRLSNANRLTITLAP